MSGIVPATRKPKTKREQRKQEIITALPPITLEDIKKGFNAHDLIESISERLLPTAVRTVEDGRYALFDPEPFHIAFEHTLKNLQQIREKVDKDIGKRATACRSSERDYKSKLKELNKTFDEISESFKLLDTRISIISKKAVRIGSSLESVETERTNAANAMYLIELITKLNSTNSAESAACIQCLMEEITSSKHANAMKSAMTVKTLLIIAQELDIDQTERAKVAIRQLGVDVENHLLKKFESATRLVSYSEMAEIASILFAFNGGDSCIDIYISTLDFLKDEKSLYKIEEPLVEPPKIVIHPDQLKEDSSSSSHEELPPFEELPVVEELDLADLLAEPKKPDEKNPKEEPEPETLPDPIANRQELESFFSKLLKNIEQQHAAILKVFKPPYEVFEVLIRTAFATTISTKVRNMLKDKRDLECYLKTLAFSMSKSKELAEKLFTLYPTYNAHLIISEFVFKSLLTDYINLEITSLVKFLNGLIDDQLMKKKLEIQRKKAKAELESKTKLGFVGEMAGRILGQDEIKPEVELNAEIPVAFISRVQEAVSRCILLCPDDAIPANITRIFKTLLREFGSKYIQTCLDTVVQRISIEEPRTEPQTRDFFDCVALTNSNMIQVQRLFFTKVRPHMEGARNEQTVCHNEKQQLLNKLEDLVIQGLTKILSLMVLWVKKLLREQGRNDFRPAEDEISIGEVSKACLNVCAFLDTQHKIIIGSLDGKNLETFLIEFGRRVLETVLVHIRNFTISYGTGGLALMTDLRKYRETIGRWGVGRLEDEYEILYHIEKVYMVRAEELKGIIKDSPILKNMRRDELESFISKRTDYSRSWVGKYF